MFDNNNQLPFFARYLEEEFCEDLSAEEMNGVRGGLRVIRDDSDRPPIHPVPIDPLPKPAEDVHPRPRPRPRPYPPSVPRPTGKLGDVYITEF